MRLLLSSQYLHPSRCPPIMLPRSPAARAGVVANALDESRAGRAAELARETRTLEALGYRCAELDLREHFGTGSGALVERLGAFDLVWVLGGNTFVLARAMSASGFVDELPDVLRRRPDAVYGGYSAGACVAGPDLAGIDLMDDPAVLPEGYPPGAEPRCLALVPFRIVPHWRGGDAQSGAAERAAAALAGAGLEHRCLRDGQSLTVEDGAVRLT